MASPILIYSSPQNVCMETSIFTGFGHFCRYIIIAVIAVTSINATLTNEEVLAVRDSSTPNTNLANFRGETIKYRRVALKWQSAPLPSAAYSIEKSRDGENFAEVDSKKIRQVNGEFQWIDEYPKLINCYRLKMTDSNGATTYSRTLVVHVPKTGDVTMVSATPDLSVNDIDVDLDMKEPAMVNMTITDKDGNNVIRQNAKGSAGLNQFTVKGSHALKPGDYFLKVVVNGSDALLVKLIKE
jgi:hypothetical protein